MSGDLGQDDIDKLLADALGGNVVGGDDADSASDADAAAEDGGGAQSQDDIDALLAGLTNAEGGDSAVAPIPEEIPSEPPTPEPEPEDEGPVGQDDIDALLAEAAASSQSPADNTEPEPAADEGGAASQAEIDALLGAAAPAEAGSEATEPETETSGGQADQSEIDALFSQMAGSDSDRLSDPNARTQTEVPSVDDGPPAAEDEGGAVDQNDIDALLAGIDDKADSPAEPEPGAGEIAAFADESASQEDIDALLAGVENEPAPAAEVAEPPIAEASAEPDTPELEPEAAVDAMIEEAASTPEPEEQAVAAEALPADEPAAAPDVDEFLGGLTEPVGTASASDAMTDVFAETASAPEPPAPDVAPPPASQPGPAIPPVDMSPYTPSTDPLGGNGSPSESIKESLSLLTSAGEVEGIAGQIASLLGQLSERARRYQHVWVQSDQEAKILRSRLMAEEHRSKVLEAERDTISKEMSEMRQRVSEIEGEKLAQAESGRTQVAALQMQIREQESRQQMLQSEVSALKEELEKARTEATGSDLESRRSRFDADRIRGELDSERMERMRLQRALDNREKEIQAMQAQSAGQASSLFLDELHRLVRRLESELDVRTSACHEAMAIMDKLIVSDDMVPVQSNLRAALQTAAGLDFDQGDALGSLSRESGYRSGAPAKRQAGRVEPGQQTVDIVSFETAISSFDLKHAHEVMVTLIRNGQASAAQLMEKFYRCPSLRRPEVSDHLDGAIKILKGVLEIQQEADKRRGREGPEASKVFVQMFDYLHNLVRLKLITRATADAWQFFLDLRGRFSFVTSDKQWCEYRDRVLNGG